METDGDVAADVAAQTEDPPSPETPAAESNEAPDDATEESPATEETAAPVASENAADPEAENGKTGLPIAPTEKSETGIEEQQQIRRHKDVIAELENAVKREVNARKVRHRELHDGLRSSRQELEDMLMRMERHLRTEEEARKNSETLLETSLQNEVRLKKELDTVRHRQKGRDAEIEEQLLKTESDRQELETMRQQYDAEIIAARDEAQKAIEDLKTVEDRVRAAERVELSKMESEYQKRISVLGLELERVRQELIIRTRLLTEEMERWRQQAEITSAAVIEAKAEVTERKRDLDTTREKMDKLMDRLHVGREHGLVLQASLTAANAYTTQAQRSLIQSMEASFQNNVQQALPWGGQISTGETVHVTETFPDPMAIMNRGVVSAGGKTATKGRMIEGNKPTKIKAGRGRRR